MFNGWQYFGPAALRRLARSMPHAAALQAFVRARELLGAVSHVFSPRAIRENWGLLILLMLSSGAIGAAGYRAVQHAVDGLVRWEAEQTADDWARHFIRRIPNLGAIANGQALSPADVEVVEDSRSLGPVFLFKLFDRRGNLRLSSDNTSTFSDHNASLQQHNPDAARSLVSGKAFVAVKDGTGRVNRPRNYAEAYVPVVKDGLTVAVVEVYVDQVGRYAAYSAIAANASLIIAGLVALAFGIPAVAFAVRSRQVQILRVKQKEEELALQDVRFKTALDNMGEGLCMFDADKRLVVCNDHYAKLYQLPPELLQAGTPHSAIIAHRVTHGVLKCEKTDAAAERKISALAQLPADARSSRVDELADGRLICITRQPMPGGGWVATHRDITEQRRSEAKMAHMALHDALTGLPNRALLSERLEQALSRTARGEIVATHILDLDHFKEVNDTLGHPVGDGLLQMVADRLRALVRETDTIARMGGDEFAIVQVALSQVDDSIRLAERIIAEISEPYDIQGHQVVVGTSVGIAVAPLDGTSPDNVIKNADLALYRAKSDGRGTFRFFEPDMDARMQARRSLEQDLRKALTRGEFELQYQPIINLDSNEIVGLEALIRWRHPENGLVSPGTFIPLAEETGLIVSIGEWVIREACATAARWPGGQSISVNLSPAQFRSPGLLQAVVRALAASGLSASRLELEITETILLQNSEATLAVLHQLRELGVRIAMDDFGTGYSSLSHLQRFPFDKIKIDRSFIEDIGQNIGSLNIVRAVSALAIGLGVAATAEGVETKEQLDRVRAEGCTEMQGFLLSKPLPAHEVEHYLLSQAQGRQDASSSAAA